MPQLPSGRHIAISANPLAELLNHASEAGNVHQVMGIDSVSKMLKYFEVLYLMPKEAAPDSATVPDLRKESDIPPPDLVMFNSGFSLADWDALTADWSEEDKEAFQGFLDGRAKPLLDKAWQEVEAKQRDLRQGGTPLSRILAAWYEAGVHPAQEEGWEESDVGGPDWDDYDVLAALGQIRMLLPEHPQYLERWQTQARLEAIWQVFARQIAFPDHWPDAQRPVRECADEARQGGWMDRLAPEKQNWLHDQAIIEIVELWNVLGDGFRAAMPQPYGIVELVVCSPEANRFFEGHKHRETQTE